MRLNTSLIGVIALALVGTLMALWLAPAGLSHAPEITVTSLDGTKLQIGTPRGRPLLVSFWATSCRGCREELPQLAELYTELAPLGLDVIGIAMAYDPPDRVIALSRARNIPYPVALDIRGEAARAFGNIDLIPASFLIAADGRVVFQHTGQLDIERLRSLVRNTLAHQDGADLRLAAR